MNATLPSWRILIATIPALCLAVPACQPAHSVGKGLPPAYTSNQITDPALAKIAEEVKNWGLKEADAAGKPLYSRIEVLPLTPIVQPYGVGVFQQELRLPAIFTTGPGWSGLKHPEKEDAVVRAFNHIAGLLRQLDRKPTLRPTLTVQTPQGIGLAWINHLEGSGNNVHGDD